MENLRLHEYVSRIRRLIQDNRQDEAMAHCLHILRLYPKHIQTYYLLGEACFAGQIYQTARQLFQCTLSADPEHFDAWLGLASTYELEGKLAEALWPAHRAFDLAPSNPKVRWKLQHLVISEGTAPQADSGVGQAGLSRGALARLYASSGLYERATGEFLAVLRRDPDLPDIRVALAEALWHQRCYPEAAEACIQLLGKLPHCLKANLILGTIRARGGDQEAEARLRIARALDPENLMSQEMMGEESPLPFAEVLVTKWQAGVTRPTRGGEVRVEAEARAQEIPEWVRELELDLID
jgi:tetratricopeptide (TPR) repeat protein